jgi:hypothetical protein
MSVAGATDFTQILGNFKIRYARKYKEVRGKSNIISDFIAFERQAMLGQNFQIPIVLTYQGGENFTPAGDTNNYRTPVSAQIPYAVIDNNEIVMVLRLPFGVIAKASNGDAVAFATPEVLKMLTLTKSMARSQEVSFVHGQSSVGQVLSGGLGVGLNNTFYQALVVTAGLWSPGLYSGVDNHPYQFASNVVGASGILRNLGDGTQDYVLLAASGIAARQLGTRTLTFAYKVSGTLTAPTVAGAVAITNGDYIFRASSIGSPNGAGGAAATLTGTECLGMRAIMVGADTAAPLPTLFTIATTYTLWSSPSLDAAQGVLTTSYIYRLVSALRDNGLEDDIVCVTSTRSWSNVLTELQTQRDFDVSYSINKLQGGTNAIELASDGIKVNVVSHPYFMWGDAFLFPKSAWMRLGSAEPTMELDGIELSVMSANNSSIEFRIFSAQALLPIALGQCGRIKNILPQ